MNFTDLQASIGRVQLMRQKEFERIRLAIARRYTEDIVGSVVALEHQQDVLEAGHARHLFEVTLPGNRIKATRDEILLELRRRNIGASIHYAPLHMMKFYERFRAELPVTEDLGRRLITLPISASMSEEDVDYVVENMIDVLKD
jgi:dTDP-4-amino-4,6-dideoxygalactose transaminase